LDGPIPNITSITKLRLAVLRGGDGYGGGAIGHPVGERKGLAAAVQFRRCADWKEWVLAAVASAENRSMGYVGLCMVGWNSGGEDGDFLGVLGGFNGSGFAFGRVSEQKTVKPPQKLMRGRMFINHFTSH
jgi:hypothetical protein